MKDVSVIICDDSILVRNLIERIINQAEGLVLAAKTINGKFLLNELLEIKPDIILLDLEMPEMNGIEFLKERKRLGIDIPVVVLSSLAVRKAKITMEALSLGASDFILKPSGSSINHIHTVRDEIVYSLLAYGKNYIRSKKTSLNEGSTLKLRDKTEINYTLKNKNRVIPLISREKGGMIEIVVIGISTGGPEALRQILPDIAPDFPVPILIVQHMPARFTTEFAENLNQICPLNVKECTNGDVLSKGEVFIAPGDFHIEVEKRNLGAVIRTSSTDLRNGHRPSIDILFASVAKYYGGNSLAVIMTGMGRDGTTEIGTIFARGGITVGQDEDSSVVYGMPKVAAERGFIDYVVPKDKMAQTLNRLVRMRITYRKVQNSII